MLQYIGAEAGVEAEALREEQTEEEEEDESRSILFQYIS